MRETINDGNLGKGEKVSVFFYLEKENKTLKAEGMKNHFNIQTEKNDTTEKTHEGLQQKIKHEEEKKK